MTRLEKPALRHEGGGDYVLEDYRCWITVGKLSVRVARTDEGVVVDIYPHKREAEVEAIASCYAYDSEGDTEGDSA